jgi:hypothetical protein
MTDKQVKPKNPATGRDKLGDGSANASDRTTASFTTKRTTSGHRGPGG